MLADSGDEDGGRSPSELIGLIRNNYNYSMNNSMHNERDPQYVPQHYPKSLSVQEPSPNINGRKANLLYE